MKIRKNRGIIAPKAGIVTVQAGSHKMELVPKCVSESGLKRFAHEIVRMLRRWYDRKRFSGSITITGACGRVSVANRGSSRRLRNDIFKNLFNVMPAA